MELIGLLSWLEVLQRGIYSNWYAKDKIDINYLFLATCTTERISGFFRLAPHSGTFDAVTRQIFCANSCTQHEGVGVYTSDTGLDRQHGSPKENSNTPHPAGLLSLQKC